MPAVEADALTVANPRRSHPYLALVATACAMVLAIAALTMSLVALNQDASAPAPRAAVTATAPGQLPVCPLHGRC